VSGGHVEAECLDQTGEPRRLSLRELQDEPRERGGVDDRVLERAIEAAPHQPGVERVMAVLDQHGTLGEAEECPARVAELGGADQHRSVDVMAPARVRVDRRAAVDQRVEERQRAVELEPLGPYLEHQERGVAGGLHVQGDELGVLESRARTQVGRVDGDLLPRHRRGGAARLEQDRPGTHLAKARALRAKAISSAVTARSSRAAPA